MGNDAYLRKRRHIARKQQSNILNLNILYFKIENDICHCTNSIRLVSSEHLQRGVVQP